MNGSVLRVTTRAEVQGQAVQKSGQGLHPFAHDSTGLAGGWKQDSQYDFIPVTSASLHCNHPSYDSARPAHLPSRTLQLVSA